MTLTKHERRTMRRSLGSRAARRAGTKSRHNPALAPRVRLRALIDARATA